MCRFSDGARTMLVVRVDVAVAWLFLDRFARDRVRSGVTIFGFQTTHCTASTDEVTGSRLGLSSESAVYESTQRVPRVRTDVGQSRCC